MSGGKQVRPGRAERLRLRRRLATAIRGAELLERKLVVLRERHRRLLAAQERAEQSWRELLGDAETWLARGLLLSGERALQAAAIADAAEVTVTWTTAMGVRLPTITDYRGARRTDTEALPANGALLRAEAAFRHAVRAAAECAAAETAVRRLGAEAERTLHRVRALRRHWIPRLSVELARVEQALEQAEQEEAIRRRWSAGLTRNPTSP